jgi:hypothetical protein
MGKTSQKYLVQQFKRYQLIPSIEVLEEEIGEEIEEYVYKSFRLIYDHPFQEKFIEGIGVALINKGGYGYMLKTCCYWPRSSNNLIK